MEAQLTNAVDALIIMGCILAAIWISSAVYRSKL